MADASMTLRTPDTCCAANQRCKAAANFEELGRCGRCYACGEAVCTAPGCSMRTKRYRPSKGRAVRICYNCARPQGAETAPIRRALDAAIYRVAGYPEYAEKIRRGEVVL